MKIAGAMALVAILGAALLLSLLTNNPYRPGEENRNVVYWAFSEEPKHLDPARSYSADEYEFLGQIYEPPFQYHFLKRPFVLEPLTAASLPKAACFDKAGRLLPENAPDEQVAKVVYEVRLKPGIRYADHPCFARTPDGAYRYHLGPDGTLPKIGHPDELPFKGTRELIAEDYVYQAKRLANPLIECPITQTLASYVEGFSEFQGRLEKEIERIRFERRKAAGAFYNQEADERVRPIHLDLRTYDFPGVLSVDRTTFRVVLKKRYPQILYWLAMTFFAPVPWEADRFYTQPAARAQNITLDRFPVGTGPYTLAVNRPNYRIVLRRNPNYREDFYPREGNPEDAAAGLLQDAGKRIPFVDEAVYVLEREGAPYWSKFLQGYYDTSGISSDVFDRAVRVSIERGAELTEDLQRKGIRLSTAVYPTTYFWAVNMRDEFIGGADEKRKVPHPFPGGFRRRRRGRMRVCGHLVPGIGRGHCQSLLV